jgi:hypothetical protein
MAEELLIWHCTTSTNCYSPQISENWVSQRTPFLWMGWGNVIESTCLYKIKNLNKMNCELMLTYDTPALQQTGSRNLTGQKTLPTIWHTYMKFVIKYQIPVINSCLEKRDEK